MPHGTYADESKEDIGRKLVPFVTDFAADHETPIVYLGCLAYAPSWGGHGLCIGRLRRLKRHQLLSNQGGPLSERALLS